MLFVDVREEPEGITDTQGFSFHLEDALPYSLDRIEITVRSRMPL